LGLVADGVGDAASKSIYRYTGVAVTDVTSGNNVIAISGMGNIRPYDGQVCYFGELYNFVDTIAVTNGGSGYVLLLELLFLHQKEKWNYCTSII
jgi:hypothetical protein